MHVYTGPVYVCVGRFLTVTSCDPCAAEMGRSCACANSTMCMYTCTVHIHPVFHVIQQLMNLGDGTQGHNIARHACILSCFYDFPYI